MIRKLIVVGGFVLMVCGLAFAQQPKPLDTPPRPVMILPQPDVSPKTPAPVDVSPDKPDFPFPLEVTRPQAVVPKVEPSIEQLLTQVETIRAQKAELERKEKAIMNTVRERAEQLKLRIEKIDGEQQKAPMNRS